MKCNGSVDILYVSASKVCILLYFIQKRTVIMFLNFWLLKNHFNMPYYFTQLLVIFLWKLALVYMTEYSTLCKSEYTETLDDHYIVIVTEIWFLCLKNYLLTYGVSQRFNQLPLLELIYTETIPTLIFFYWFFKFWYLLHCIYYALTMKKTTH